MSSNTAGLLLQGLLFTILLLLLLSQTAASSSSNHNHQNTIKITTTTTTTHSNTRIPQRQLRLRHRATQTQKCYDTLLGWSDIGGPQYNCEWYASRTKNCNDYGNFFANYGTTAKEVCCSCGGGGFTSSDSLPPTATVTAVPTAVPNFNDSTSKQPTTLSLPVTTPSPLPPSQPQTMPLPSSPSSTSYPCTDSIEGWYDIGGPNYNCTWYSIENNCNDYGAFFARGGNTAKHVCCVCGGGFEDQNGIGNENKNETNETPTMTPSSSNFSDGYGEGEGSATPPSPGSDTKSSLPLDDSFDLMTLAYIAIGVIITAGVWFLTRNEGFK